MKAAAIVAGIVVLLAFVAVAGTYVAIFAGAMGRPAKSPLTVECAQLAPPGAYSVRVRFDVANAARKDATWINLALFAAGFEHRNVSDWDYQLELRVPGGGRASKVVEIPLNADYRGLQFSAIRCNPINAVFADGSEQRYGSGPI